MTAISGARVDDGSISGDTTIKIGVQIFGFDGPMTTQSPFGASTNRPSDPYRAVTLLETRGDATF
jgi:hypothetical protein